MKRAVTLILVCFLLILGACGQDTNEHETTNEHEITNVDKTEITYYFKTTDHYFSIYDGDDFKEVYLNGVNLGSGKPGYYPGELAITKEEYLRWFEKISEMNANTIRVYTVMMPCFYEALYEYNQTSEQKLYLFQGVWYNEDEIAKSQDAYAIYEEAFVDAKNLVDIMHGNCLVEETPGKAYGYYGFDVSSYVIGWILGIESDELFVEGTAVAHPDLTDYEGEYLTIEDGTPYERFMCMLADQTISYEMEKYQQQRPVSWSNWPTTDTLTHENEPYEKEDTVSIDVEKMQPTEQFEAGVFASYHIYPYYPDAMKYEEKYAAYVDDDGKLNTYKAYLEDLIATHTIPVLVAEYGVPASRGCTHVNEVTGFDQGNLSETEQGEMLASMASDIYESGYAGGLAFTWQDEWFKRTWNTMDYTDEDRRAYWSDTQTSEQNFGLLAFDPGEEETISQVDGDLSEWKVQDLLAGDETLSISAKSDEKYLYLCIQGTKLDTEDYFVIPLDITPASGSLTYGTYEFLRAADFVIELDGKENSRVLVQSYYDRYAYQYSQMDEALDTTGYENPQSSIFNPIYLALSSSITLPVDGTVLPMEKYDTGLLLYGNSNPNAKEYHSLADFCYGAHGIEVRIPWGLLNFRDPSTKEIEGDFYKKDGFTGEWITGIGIGVCTEQYGTLDMTTYSWENWNEVTYHERLKQSYYLLGDCYSRLTLE